MSCVPPEYRPIPEFATVEEWNTYAKTQKHVDFDSFDTFVPLPSESPKDAVVNVTLLKAGYASAVPTHLFVDAPKDDTTYMPVYAFLVQHPQAGDYVFDLGMRSEKRPYKNKDLRAFVHKNTFTIDKGVEDILVENQVPLESLKGIILSHTHFDHTGDVGAFPPSAPLILGLDTTSDFDKLSDELEIERSVLDEREVKILDRQKDKWAKYGAFYGVDLLGDSSVVFCHCPGHRNGHAVALVRIAASPDRYFVLGGDTCHHCTILSGQNKLSLFNSPAQKDKLVSMADNPTDGYESIARARKMDQEPNVIYWLAHDLTFAPFLDETKDFCPLPADKESFERIKNRKRV